jgi:hypothetical protein
MQPNTSVAHAAALLTACRQTNSSARNSSSNSSSDGVGSSGLDISRWAIHALTRRDLESQATQHMHLNTAAVANGDRAGNNPREPRVPLVAVYAFNDTAVSRDVARDGWRSLAW